MPIRKKGITISKPILYGSLAIPLTPEDREGTLIDPTHTHRWTLFVKGLDPTQDDLSSYVKKVTFKLHESFPEPLRTIESPPYQVTETGWGEFEIVIKIHFMDSAEKPVVLYHHLQLYPKDEQGKKDQVLSEKYDEIVFQEPTEDMFEILNALPPMEPIQKANQHAHYNSATEQAELDKLTAAVTSIKAEYEEYTTRLKLAEEELDAIKHEREL